MKIRLHLNRNQSQSQVKCKECISTNDKNQKAKFRLLFLNSNVLQRHLMSSALNSKN